MRKRHRIGEPPAWQRKLLLIIAAIFGATLLLFAAWAVILFSDWKRVDVCEEQGGRYDYEQGVCEYADSADARRETPH